MFEVKSQVKRRKTRILHYDRVKPYTAGDLPGWVSGLQQKLR